ncbi:MAG: DUF3466 family protein [Cyanobacteria bacterium J06621_8]
MLDQELIDIYGGRYAVTYALGINNNGHIVGQSNLENEYYRQYYESNPRLFKTVTHAYVYDGDSLTDIHPEIENLFGDDINEDRSNGSSAKDINDYGAIVGYYASGDSNYTPDKYKAFISGSQSINLHSLLNNDNLASTAHDINNQGQVLGIAREKGTKGTSSSFSYFIYSDGQIKFVEPYLNNINDSGQAAGSLKVEDELEAIIYDTNNDEIINLNDLIYNDGFILRSAAEINEQGLIAANGYFIGDQNRKNNAFLLNPQFAEPELDDYINIGNISTFGDSVLLQGNEITLSGEAITTAGGEITFDGATIVESNLVIDSSVTEEEVITDGADITFTKTLDAAGAGSQNLTFKAGTGNILFSETVGGEAAFFDLAVAGAGSVTANNDLAIDGNLSLEVINDVTAANLSAAGLVNISLGKVEEETYDSTGNVTTGNIEALAIEVLNNGNFTAGELTATAGDINVISLNQLNVGQLAANDGAIDLISGTAGINVSGSVQGDNGFVALAQQDIVTDEITSTQDAVILKSSQGAVTVNGLVTANGDVSLAAANNVTVDAVTSSDESVAVISATGIVNLAGAISAKEDLTIASAQSLLIDQEIKAELGTIALVSSQSSVTVNVAINSAISVNIAAKQNVLTRKIRTYGGGVFVDAEQGTATIRGKINSRGGDISLSALGRVRTKNIISRSGDVFVISDTSAVRTGYIRTDRGNRSGDVYLEAGRNIKVAASVEINGEQYSIYAGDDGVINIAQQQNRKQNKRGEFIVGDTSKSGTLEAISGQLAFLEGDRPPSPSPVIPIIKGILDFITTPRPVEPPNVVDINPITGDPYVNDDERELVKQLTLKQEEELRKIYNSKDPKFAPSINISFRTAQMPILTEHILSLFRMK